MIKTIKNKKSSRNQSRHNKKNKLQKNKLKSRKVLKVRKTKLYGGANTSASTNSNVVTSKNLKDLPKFNKIKENIIFIREKDNLIKNIEADIKKTENFNPFIKTKPNPMLLKTIELYKLQIEELEKDNERLKEEIKASPVYTVHQLEKMKTMRLRSNKEKASKKLSPEQLRLHFGIGNNNSNLSSSSIVNENVFNTIVSKREDYVSGLVPKPDNVVARHFNEEQPLQEITHFWYKGWPDHGVPDLKKFLEFIKTIMIDIQTKRGGTVVHCSAGVGRTGVVIVILRYFFDNNITIDTMVKNDSLTKENIDSIISIIMNERQHRRTLVQTMDQLLFIIHVCIGIKLDDKINEHLPLISYIKEKNLFDQTNEAAFYNIKKVNYENYIGYKCIFRNGDKKNRYENVLPENEYRVKLDNDESCKGYINASIMDPLKVQFEHDQGLMRLPSTLIAAQCPTSNPENIQDFLKMLDQNGINRIIMVTNMFEPTKGIKCNSYTNNPSIELVDKGRNMDWGSVIPFLLETPRDNDIRQYKLIINNK